MQDYKVMVHKGLGSDKAICGSRSGDFRSVSFFPLADHGDDSMRRHGKSDLFGLSIVRLILAGSSIFPWVFPVVDAGTRS